MEKPADNQYEIHALIRRRWSPRAFGERPVALSVLRSLFEAARWAPSAMNEQPWRFIVGLKPEETYGNILHILVEANRLWAQAAPLLVLIMGKESYSNNQKPNGTFAYDTGQAVAQLTIEAIHQGLFVHQMAGFDSQMARENFGIPAGFAPLAVMAIGYPGNPASLPEELYKREVLPRKRHAINGLVFGSTFGQPSVLFENEE